ncbi:MAG: caspase family protein, partial [Deltaproteobacteria bacterium]|nr:caspase family protein [Deltaproteobacteria bacterium]
MKTLIAIVTFSTLIIGFEQHASAMTIRYALVLGNNVGVDADGKQPFPPLKHAEKEAQILKERLVGLSNFDESNARTRLLAGATRKQLKAAVHSLVRQKKKDQQLLGKVDTMFLFYFTGHGLQERLLLQDGPISADELGELFNSMGADFSVGVFDACYSG